MSKRTRGGADTKAAGKARAGAGAGAGAGASNGKRAGKGASSTGKASGAAGGSSLYDFTATGIDGDEIPLSRFRGKVCLVVNGASR